ncbi:MAG: ATP-dependent helicase [Paludibacter sp.]|nr:ATP-dependent helicase [Paludibacter sp.]
MNGVKIWGAPGTGKTTELLREIKEETHTNGIEKLTITTFRRDAADEIKTKVSVLTGNNESELGNINTIHGICYGLLGRPEVITDEELKAFGKKYGYETPDAVGDPGDPEDVTAGDMKNYFNFYSWMKNTCTPLSDYRRYPNISDLKEGHNLKSFYTDYEDFKNEVGKIDFSDMLTKCYEQGLTPDTKILIVDEFQDLTRQQYDIFKTWVDCMENVIIAGDPLQSIYPFWGGSPDYFFEWDAEEKILSKSHRLPFDVWTAAKDTLRFNGRQETPDIETKKDSGIVRTIGYRDMEYYFTKHYENATGTTFHLVRANHQVIPIAYILAGMGIPFFNNLCGWTENNINLLNALVKIRNWIIPTTEEINALVDNYSVEYFKGESNKTELKKSITKAGRAEGFKRIENKLIDLIRGGDPVDGLQKAGDLKKKKIGVMLQKNKILNSDQITTYIKTLHGSKGLEADTVFLHTGITQKINKSILDYEKMKDEARVWYVGLSRAAKTMYVVEDKGKRFNVCA